MGSCSTRCHHPPPVLTEREEEGGGAAERELTGGRKKGVAQLRGSSPEGGRRGRSN
jgi:hypothetical protein